MFQIVLGLSFDIDSDKWLCSARSDKEPSSVFDVDPDSIDGARNSVSEPLTNPLHHILLLLIRTLALLFSHEEGRQPNHQFGERHSVLNDRIEDQHRSHRPISHWLVWSIEYPSVLFAPEHRLLSNHRPRHVNTSYLCQNHSSFSPSSNLCDRH